jgi:nitrite reductase/ring-hydroxylating ferredoxin subunit
MLSREENELLCRVGAGTPMGDLLRQYWIPALPSYEFPEPDGPPKRMTLLGDNLVMFRDSDGRMGALAEACPHRGASLYFGRNEECGLRCPYHGWKFDVNGTCVDVPTERSDSRVRAHLMETVRAGAFPCVERNHMVWVYLGPRITPPPFPRFPVLELPAENVLPPQIMMEEANWVQNLEGDLDSVHLNFVHRRLTREAEPPKLGMPGFWSPDPEPPRLDVVRTDYGCFYSAMRSLDDGTDWHRINQFIFPFHTMISVGPTVNLRSFVPIDDHYAMLISQSGVPYRPVTDEEVAAAMDPFGEVGGYEERTNDPRTYFFTKANKRNDYWRDLEVQKDRMYNGIPFVLNLQDRAMTELMCGPGDEPLYDRTQEHLGGSDAMVIMVRRQLIAAARTLREQDIAPPNLDNPDLDRVRSATLILPEGADWQTISADARDADSGAPIAADAPLILD